MTTPLAILGAVTTCPAPKETGGGIFGALAKPIASVLAAFYHVVPSYGVAILGLSIVWMIIISPLTLKSTRSMLAMQRIQPQLKKLQEQHRNDRQAFAQAQMELFREEGVSPFGSCLPMLLPLPVFFALFRVIDGLSHKSHGCTQPRYLSPHTQMFKDIVAGNGSIHSFGMDLAKNALSSHSSFLAAIPFFVLLIIMIGTQYGQTAQMMRRNPAAADNPQAKMMKYIPIVFGVICIRFPAGVVLYYSMSNLCRIGQQSAMYRFDPKVRSLVAKEVIEVEARTAEIDDEVKGGGKGGKGRTALAEAPKSKPKSRFAAMLEQANERDRERRTGKDGANGASGGNGSGGNGSSGNGSSGNAKGAPAGKAASGAKGAAGGKGPASKGASGSPKAGAGAGTKPGAKPAGKNGNGSRPSTKNGNGSGNGNGSSGNGKGRPQDSPPIKTNRSRTGARSGAGSRKRRGR